MLLKQGDRGPGVSEVQKLLSLLGYDLIIDGDFGAKTARSIRAFQKKMNLTVDGVVGNKTLDTLKAAQKNSASKTDTASDKSYGDALEIIQHPMDSGQYIKQKFDKKQIFIHYTAGSSSAKNCISWWNSNEPRIATAYVIDGNDGRVYEAFNPDYWSYHLGIKGSRGKLDKISIGIEICNWGYLTKKGDKFYTYTDREIDSSEVCELDTPHRGHKYYHKYTDEQMENLEKLLIYLVNEYDIPVADSYGPEWYEYQGDVIKSAKPGIWTHTTVRKDKFDSYPDHRLNNILNNLKNKI